MNTRLFRRRIRFWWQRRTRGWDDSDTWNLCGVIAKFALPRLKRFKEQNIGFPGDYTWESWNSELDDMIYALSVCVKEHEQGILDVDGHDWDRVGRGLSIFGERFRDLWW